MEHGAKIWGLLARLGRFLDELHVGASNRLQVVISANFIESIKQLLPTPSWVPDG
jgi:hypothetical protein